mgnify:CR=1 FL=1
MADKQSKELMAFAITTANQDRLKGNPMRVYLAPEMGLDALDLERSETLGSCKQRLV